jgi:hypothetical protein
MVRDRPIVQHGLDAAVPKRLVRIHIESEREHDARMASRADEVLRRGRFASAG